MATMQASTTQHHHTQGQKIQKGVAGTLAHFPASILMLYIVLRIL